MKILKKLIKQIMSRNNVATHNCNLSKISGDLECILIITMGEQDGQKSHNSDKAHHLLL